MPSNRASIYYRETTGHDLRGVIKEGEQNGSISR